MNPSCLANCQPPASVAITSVGIKSTIFGINLLENSTRAGMLIRPMMGPMMKPRKRSIAVLFELKKERPNGQVIEKLMKRFLYTAGLTGAMQVATLIIMTRIATL